MTTQLAERPDETLKPIEQLRAQLAERAEEFRMVLPAHITPDKLQRTILTAVQQNPELLRCDRRSLLTSCMKAAQDGLLPDGREAAIVPFKHRFKDEDGWHETKLAQYLPMSFGLRKKILQSEEVTDLCARVVYRQELEAKCFVYEEGTARQLRHKPLIDPSFRPKDEDIALAYSVATFANGTKSFEVMRRFEIDDVREASQTGALFDHKGQRREPKGPWVEWFAEMAKKTVIRRHSKSLPMSSDVFPDVEAEDMAFAAKSAVALLDSRKQDAPTSEPGPASGFSVEGEEFTKETLIADEEQLDVRTLADPPDPDEKLDVRTVEDLQDEGDVALTEPPEPPPVEPPPPDEVDDYGLTKDPAEALAEDYIKRASRCELLVDLKSLLREAEVPLLDMAENGRGDLVAKVDEEFARARLRLTPKPKEGTDAPAV